MRDRIRRYDDPANFDITNRASPRELSIELWVGFVISPLSHALGFLVTYAVLGSFIDRYLPINPDLKFTFFAVIAGAFTGMAIYFPKTKKKGFLKRAGVPLSWR